MKKLFILLAIAALFSSCSGGNLIWGKHDNFKQQKDRKPFHGLSGRHIGRGW